ncbi:WRKY domain-containing protein [Cephalotus follicularis]|uniref:WRKY domain-containing protein n=1 Tax=Cephalotus follicularis TaxID=3775 RepID=A0A1Q3CIA7_CEPFO|nr:WRKY domain-containing protein [Cephalotus follicularis]
MNHNANGVVSGTGDGGGRASIAERRAAKCGFNAERINTARFRTTSPLASPVVGSPPCLTIPPGISPTALLDSPILLPNSQFQGADMNSQDLSLVEPPIIFEFPVQLSKAIANCSARDSVTDVKDINNMIENDSCCDLQLCRSDVSSSETSLLKAPIQGEDVEMHHLLEGEQKGTNLPVVTARTSEDGYNWRKYGQKQVKCSEYPRSYYKCTYPNCLVKKKVECSHDGQITEIIYNGAHSHQKPQPSCQASLGSAFPLEEMSEIGEDGITCVKIEGGSVWTNIQKGSKNVQLGSDWSADVLERTSSTSGVTEVSDPLSTAQGKSVRVFQAVETPEFPLASHGDDNDDDGATQGSMSVGDDADDDESESKRRRIESSMIETNLTSRAVREPRVVVQIESEVDILDDGYRWRKYGQKVVKGNPNPRSYYKCTSPGCSVRKHVERASHNLKYVITTYEGKHNHEVPAARNSSHVNLSGSDVPPEVANAQSTLTLPQTTRGQKPETGIQNITPCFDRKPEFNSEYLRPGVPWSSMYQMNFPLLQNMVPFFGLNSNCTGAQHPGSIASFPDFHISMPSNFSTNMNLSLGGMTFNNNGNIIDPVQPFLLGQQLKDDKMRLLRPKEEQKDENVYDACIPIIDHANPASALSSYHQVMGNFSS